MAESVHFDHDGHDIEAEVIVHAWKEPEFKEKLLSHPKETLVDMGCIIPEDVQCQIVEEPARTWTVVLPKPPKNLALMTDEDLLRLAAGEAHPLHRGEIEEEGIWRVFTHRYWPYDPTIHNPE